jgi:hypothetical protein
MSSSRLMTLFPAPICGANEISCLLFSALRSIQPREAKAALAGGCGSCGHADPDAAEAPSKLIQLERRTQRA